MHSYETGLVNTLQQFTATPQLMQLFFSRCSNSIQCRRNYLQITLGDKIYFNNNLDYANHANVLKAMYLSP